MKLKIKKQNSGVFLAVGNENIHSSKEVFILFLAILGVLGVLIIIVGILFDPYIRDIRYAILNILDNQDKYSKSCFEYSRKRYSNANAEAIINAYLTE